MNPVLSLFLVICTVSAVTIDCVQCSDNVVRCTDHFQSDTDTECIVLCKDCVNTRVICAGLGTTCEVVCYAGQCSGSPFRLECGVSDTCKLDCTIDGSCTPSFEIDTFNSVPTIECAGNSCTDDVFVINFDDDVPAAVGFDITNRNGSIADCSWNSNCDTYNCTLPLLSCVNGFGCASSILHAESTCTCDSTRVAVVPGLPGSPDWASRSCQSCPSGSIKTSTFNCTACEAPTLYVAPDRLSCVSECPGGYGVDTGTGTTCVACPAGKSNIDDLGVKCTDCPAGRFAPVVASPDCQSYNCPPGKAPPSDQISPCADCPAGSFSDTGGACILCSLARYQPLSGQSSCIDCLLGTTTTTSGASICTDDCGRSGAFVQIDEVSGLSRCHICPKGTQINNTADGCELCSAGRYRNVNSNAAFLAENCIDSDGVFSYERCPPDCSLCPEGTVSMTQGAHTCTPCADGLVSTDGRTSCREPLAAEEGLSSLRSRIDIVVSQEESGERGTYDHVSTSDWFVIALVIVFSVVIETILFIVITCSRIAAFEKYADSMEDAKRGIADRVFNYRRNAGEFVYIAKNSEDGLTHAMSMLIDGAAWPALQLLFVLAHLLLVVVIVQSLRFQLVMDFSTFERNYSFGPVTARFVSWIALGVTSALTLISTVLYLIHLIHGRGIGGAEPYICAVRLPFDTAALLIVILYISASAQLGVAPLWVTWVSFILLVGAISYDIAGIILALWQKNKRPRK